MTQTILHTIGWLALAVALLTVGGLIRNWIEMASDRRERGGW